MRSDYYILIGTDSLVSRFNPTIALSGLQGCKILKAGRFFVVVTGIIGQGRPAGFNAYTLLQDIAQHQKTAAASADRFGQVALRPFSKLLREFHKNNPADFARCQDKICLEILVADYNGGKPTYSVRTFRVLLKQNVPTVEMLPKYDCPGDCPLASSTMIIGDSVEANSLLQSPPPNFWAQHSQASAIEEFIRVERIAHPEEVGGAVSILALDKNGPHWVPGYQGVCPDLK